jgi:ribonuclease HI
MFVEGINIMVNWKLPPKITILGAELFAIKEALLWLKENRTSAPGSVIYTDSLSGLELLQDRTPKNYINIAFGIQNLIWDLNKQYPVIIQFIPGHKNLRGNEMADLAAKAAHNNCLIVSANLSKEEKMREIVAALYKVWQTEWTNGMQVTGKGMKLANVRDKVGCWSWAFNQSRVIETVMAKLRLGHVGLNQHLHRFGMTDSDLCRCGAIETITHFLIECPRYNRDRQQLLNKLRKINVQMSIKNMLGGGDYKKETQAEIVEVVASFLFNTGRLWEL